MIFGMCLTTPAPTTTATPTTITTGGSTTGPTNPTTAGGCIGVMIYGMCFVTAADQMRIGKNIRLKDDY